jgi:predicted nucleic acid-binding protein
VLRRDAFERIAARLEQSASNIHAPHLIDFEVISAMRRLVIQRSVNVERAQEGLSDFAAIAIVRYPAGGLTDRIWELRANMTVFDAAYIALAEALDAPLVTTDARLARAPGHRAEIQLVR